MEFDYEKPALSQVYCMGPHYLEWSNIPIQNRLDKSIILFSARGGVLEAASKAPVWLPPLVWLPISTYFYIQHTPMDFASFCIWLVACVFAWPVTEYLLHRFLFHLPLLSYVSNPTLVGILNIIQFLAHGIHHKHPRDPNRLITPLLMSGTIGIVILPIPFLLFEKAQAYAFLSGFICGYLCYDLIHYYLHFGTPRKLNPYLSEPIRTWLIDLQKRHNEHHYTRDGHHHTFGVSHILWDQVFRTITPRKKE